MDDWPDSLHEIVAVIGRQKTIQLVDSLSPCGSRSWRRCLYVPVELTPGHKLISILGEDDAKLLVAAFNGMVLHLATSKKEKIRLRSKKIRRLARLGLSTHKIASRVNVSAKCVQKVLNKQGAMTNDVQLKLI